ncbi:hypothetical protein [Brachyspira innocens]|uniref:hypothetical protein n=1 Tax=Brachyspira innocens TaxID=13264 RepID=UPI00037B6706|nr:hypothetical protein [Brachyspira innocens]
MKKIAFLIPTFPGHFNYAHDLYNSYMHYDLDEQADIWFILTTEEEKKDFFYQNNCLIYANSGYKINTNAIAVKKKFYGLYQLKDKYEYIIVLDSESLLIKNINLLQICEKYFSNKVLYGNEIIKSDNNYKISGKIKEHCKKYFISHPNNKKLNTELFLWCNQPWIYKCSTLDDFFNIFDYKNNLDKMVWYDFEYYIYMYYLILYHDFKIKDLEAKATVGIAENDLAYKFYFQSKKYKKANIMLSTEYMFKYLDNSNLFVLIHMDRTNKIYKLENRISTLENNSIKTINNKINIFTILGNFIFSIEYLQDKKITTLFGFKITVKTRPDQTRPDQTRPDQTRPDQTRPNICSDYICFYNNMQYKKIQHILQHKIVA